jgi:GcrA cell cycle regulator
MKTKYDDATLEKLRKLHAEGLSFDMIARRVGIGKNKINSLVHRLGLPPRPSPIRKTEKKPPATGKGNLRRVVPSLAELLGEKT